MKIELTQTPAPRIYEVVLDFSGYKWSNNFEVNSYGRVGTIPDNRLDVYLKELNLRRLRYWAGEYERRGKNYYMQFIYTTIVISDRE